jgi:hypothetical protein
MGGPTPIEEGLLSGFDNTEIKGFKEGTMFAPMMSSIAFVGYIFELEDGADVDAFKTTLKDSANLRWNICVEAEELIVENEDNKVFFLMCPKSFEQPETEGEGDMTDEDMIPAEDGEKSVSASDAYKLIGNAVPPLLAYHIAKRLEDNWTKYFG